MATIVITDELGTFGRELSIELARSMNVHAVDQSDIERIVATSLQVGGDSLRRVLAGYPTTAERWTISNAGLRHHFAKVFLELARLGDVVIRCPGAAAILHSIGHVVCVRLQSSMEARERVVAQRLGYGHACMARWDIQSDEAAANEWAQFVTRADWRASRLHAVTIDTGRVTPSDCVSIINGFVDSDRYRETASSREHLRLLWRSARTTAQASTFAPIGAELAVREFSEADEF